ncbi:MAG TPA: BrnT family toxin [Xanthobacteraceae bacterium]|jgi:hypothetical protein
MYEWDEDKCIQNRRKHGIDFRSAEQFEWETAFVVVDDRAEYGELREIAYGFIGDRIHALTFTRRGANVRIISLRKASRREIRAYVEART